MTALLLLLQKEFSVFKLSADKIITDLQEQVKLIEAQMVDALC